MNMQYKFKKYTVLAIMVGSFWASNTMSAQLPGIDLGTGGGTASVADGINDKGQVIGRIRTGKTNDLNRGFVWKKGVMTDLGKFLPKSINNKGQMIVTEPNPNQGGPFMDDHSFLLDNGVMTEIRLSPEFYEHPFLTVAPFKINNRGQVLITYYTFYREPQSALWEKEKGMIPLFDSDNRIMRSYDVNDRGQVVGYMSGNGFGDDHGFVGEKDVLTDLGELPQSVQTLSRVPWEIAINNNGQVAGTFKTAAGVLHGFLWQKGVYTDLGTLGGIEPATDLPDVGPFGSKAVAINDKGQVIGFSVTPAGERHAFLWQQGVMTDLGTLADGKGYSEPVAINNRGQVIGYTTNAHGGSSAFVWQKGVMTELKPLPGAKYVVISAINKRGQIVGASGFPDINFNSDLQGNLPKFRATLWNTRCGRSEEKEGKREEREERYE
jgi:probable HAF family extracellular repeat protein